MHRIGEQYTGYPVWRSFAATVKCLEQPDDSENDASEILSPAIFSNAVRKITR